MISRLFMELLYTPYTLCQFRGKIIDMCNLASMSLNKTDAPALASAMADASPMPVAAPVTMATLLLSVA